MPAYTCKKCLISDDEAVPCRICGKMLLPVEYAQIGNATLKAAKAAKAAKAEQHVNIDENIASEENE